MNRSIVLIACSGVVLLGSQAFGDDSMSRSTMTKEESMKDCIERQKTAGVNMSKAEMKRLCKIN